MLGYESERRLKNFLVAVGDGERELEHARARLCSIPDFAPHSAFQRIDRDASLQVTGREFANFLRDNQVYHVGENELHTLILFFDSNGNQRLSFQEFLQIVLPCEDNYLRNRTLDRPSRHVGRHDQLPRDIELALAQVIEKEIDLQRRLESLKRELEVQYDYSPYAAFRSVDRYNSGRCDQVNVGAFLRQNGHHASEMELLAIVRRMDTDGDAILLYSEWADFLRPASPSPRPVYPSPPRASSPGPRMGSSSPLKHSSPARSIGRGRSSSPMRQSMSPSRTSPTRKPILRVYDEDEMINCLKDLCNQEQDLENAKISLAQKHDFNLRDAFDIFDVPHHGAIDSYQLRSGLNAINVFPTHEEIELFITRWDKSGDRRIQFHEFSEAFCAHDSYYSSMVNRRPSNYTPRPIRRDDCFLANTAFEFQNMWRTHMRVETSAE
jgi:Ca2+-binding EF-hand superfamily protein